MARFAVGVMFGVVVGTVLGAAAGLHADEPTVAEAAAMAQVDPQDLAGAVATTGLPPFEYLRMVGELPGSTLPPSASSSPAAPTSGAFSSRVECVIRHESHGDPGAVGPTVVLRTGQKVHASGLGQFLPSTWMTTPQGRAGYSVFNADANRAAIAWMISVGRAQEFDAVRYYGC